MKIIAQQQWRYLFAICLTLLIGTTAARVTIDEAGKERMAQQLMGQVSGLRDMQGSLALAQEDIELLQRKLRVLKMQADQLGSTQLDTMIRGAQIELDSKVARTAAIADKAGVGKMQPYYKYAMGVLKEATPLMEGFADRVGEFAPEQHAEKEIGLRAAEAAVLSDKRTFFANMTKAHSRMADVVGKSLDLKNATSSYFDGYFEYAKSKNFVDDSQRDDLWHLISWFMLDYLSEDPPAGERSILGTMRRMRRDHDDSYDEMMQFIPQEHRPTESELGRPHSDWSALVDEHAGKEGLSKFAFILLQVGMWQATLLLGNKAIAAQKDIELDGVLGETRTKLKEMGVDADRVDKAQTALEVSELAIERMGSAKEGEDTNDLAQLATRIHEVVNEFQRATSHATSGEREIKEAAARGDSEMARRSVAPAAIASGGGERFKPAGDDFDDKEVKEQDSGGSGWVKIAVIGTGILFAAAKLYSRFAEDSWKTEEKFGLKKKIDGMFDLMGGKMKGGAKFVVERVPVLRDSSFVKGVMTRW